MDLDDKTASISLIVEWRKDDDFSWDEGRNVEKLLLWMKESSEEEKGESSFLGSSEEEEGE